MVVMVGLGAGLGAAIFALLWGLIPRRTSALVQLGLFDARDTSRPARRVPSLGLERDGGTSSGLSGVREWVGARLGEWLVRRGITVTSLRQDLALTGRGLEAVLGAKVLCAAAGFVVVTGSATTVQASAGVSLPVGSAGAVGVLAGAGLFFVPDLEARLEAAARRRDFRHALSAYLDLVSLEMAGAAAPAEALPSAARVGSGWPLALIRETLRQAKVSGQDQWEALSDLGQSVGVPELTELGTLIRQVRRSGGSVRDTLTARAATMRRRELADAEAQAGRNSQSMRIAQIIIGMGFGVFLLYPSLANVLAL